MNQEEVSSKTLATMEYLAQLQATLYLEVKRAMAEYTEETQDSLYDQYEGRVNEIKIERKMH